MAAALGNMQDGDGFRYRGNGVLQMTGRGAHRRNGTACGVDFEATPALATAPEHALKPALQEWSDNGLNAFADRDDIRTITLKINGGFNGLVERQGWLGQLKKQPLSTGDLHQGAEAGAPDDDVMWLQKSLNTLGADPVLEVNGHMDESTTPAVRTFQGAAGLIADGISGPVTKAAIRLRLSKIR